MLTPVFPTRLRVRCPVCLGEAMVLHTDYAAVQMFCAVDGVPLVVVECIAGFPREHEELQRGPRIVVWRKNGNPTPLAYAGCASVGA